MNAKQHHQALNNSRDAKHNTVTLFTLKHNFSVLDQDHY